MVREVCWLSIYCFSAPNLCFIVYSTTVDVGLVNKYFVFQLTVALLVESTGQALEEGGVVLPDPGVLPVSLLHSFPGSLELLQCGWHLGAPFLQCTALEASITLASLSGRYLAVKHLSLRSFPWHSRGWISGKFCLHSTTVNFSITRYATAVPFQQDLHLSLFLGLQVLRQDFLSELAFSCTETL